MQRRFRRRFTLIVAAATAILMLLPATALSSPRRHHRALTVTDVEVLGEVIVPSFTLFDGTEIGGLSSITYDDGRDVYYALSDDQGNRTTGDPVRYYTIESTWMTIRSTMTISSSSTSPLFSTRRIPSMRRGASIPRVSSSPRRVSSTCRLKATSRAIRFLTRS